MNDNTINIGEAINEFLNTYHLKSRYSKAQIENAWYKINGSYLSRHTQNVRFWNGVLTIKVDSAAIRNELMYVKDSIKTKINEEIGTNVVNEIRIS